MFRFVGPIISILFVLNLAFIDAYFYQQRNHSDPIPTPFICDSDCQQKIDHLVSQKLTAVPTRTLSISISPTSANPNPTTKKSSRIIQYFPIPGQGTTLENKWVDLPGTEFYLSTNDYPELSESYFEANMKLVNGNGLAYLRLFDVTAGVEVWGSEVSTSSQEFTSVSSGKLTIRQGTRLYRVQARSLTADTTVFNSGRLKFILLIN